VESMSQASTEFALTTLIDNQGDNDLLNALRLLTSDGIELCIATAFFSLDALNMLGSNLEHLSRVRLIFGDDAAASQRLKLLEAVRTLSDRDLLKQRETDPLLQGLDIARKLIAEGKLEARVYVKDKFHAKAYLATCSGKLPLDGIVGSGNFTRPGLTQNIELNIHLNKDQAPQLKDWFESVWAQAEPDIITEDLLKEILRQIELYSPYAIYLRSLLAFGDYVQGREPIPESKLLKLLDAHQEDGFRQALKLIDREGGAMVCDGVGLGKSFIALALMEHFLQRGERVLLLAPKAILRASWERYLRDFLNRYQTGFRSLRIEPITWLGFEPELTEDDLRKLAEKGESPPRVTPKLRDSHEELDLLSEQSEVIIIDESHNFRKSNSQRYVNLLRILQPKLLGRKKVILLTATPLNTDYVDVAAQFRLITLNDGALGGIAFEQLQREATNADTEARKDPEVQPNLFDQDSTPKLIQALESVAIQRSRRTCKLLAEARGKSLRFPEREAPHQLKYSLSDTYKHMVFKTEENFNELAKFLASYQKEVKRASSAETGIQSRKLILPKHGLRLSAYMPERYRLEAAASLRDAQVEAFLVSLVFTNVIKQLESSIDAFEGILRSLGAGLCARLHYVFGEEVESVLEEHLPWIQRGVKHFESELEVYDEVQTGITEEEEEYLGKLRTRLRVERTLSGFGPETHNVKLWKSHIISDLKTLAQIYVYAARAKAAEEDYKLDAVEAVVREQLDNGRKVLIFTQSVKTAHYIERELQARLDQRVDRVTADVDGEARQKILHGFSPKYNPVDQEDMWPHRCNVLVCTDVLSEGVNLQEAGCILNYDLHWNPVRLIQRIGRVDRRLRDDDEGRSFSILNVVPPPEIEGLINLVGTVEGRKRKISQLLGLDQSFFSAEDEEGTLREFNALVDGTTSKRDEVLARYSQTVEITPEQTKIAEAMPQGGFGVWKGAPSHSLYGVFWIKALPETTEEDKKKLKAVLDRPVFVLRSLESNAVETDPTKILDLLGSIKEDEQSGMPSDEDILKKTLKLMRKDAWNELKNFELKNRLTIELDCWMELRP
jgi:superfamily II DNA or RNA helicase